MIFARPDGLRSVRTMVQNASDAPRHVPLNRCALPDFTRLQCTQYVNTRHLGAIMSRMTSCGSTVSKCFISERDFADPELNGDPLHQTISGLPLVGLANDCVQAVMAKRSQIIIVLFANRFRRQNVDVLTD